MGSETHTHLLHTNLSFDIINPSLCVNARRKKHTVHGIVLLLRYTKKDNIKIEVRVRQKEIVKHQQMRLPWYRLKMKVNPAFNKWQRFKKQKRVNYIERPHLVVLLIRMNPRRVRELLFGNNIKQKIKTKFLSNWLFTSTKQ